VNRDSGTASANGGWLRRLVRLHSWADAHKNTAKVRGQTSEVSQPSGRNIPELAKEAHANPDNTTAKSQTNMMMAAKAEVTKSLENQR